MQNFKGKFSIASALLSAILSSVVSSQATEQKQGNYYQDRVIISGGEYSRPGDWLIREVFDLLYPKGDDIFKHNIGDGFTFKTSDEARQSCFNNFHYRLLNENGSFIACYFNDNLLDYCLSYNTLGKDMDNVIIGRLPKFNENLKPTEVIKRIIPILQNKYNSIQVDIKMCGDEQAFLDLGFKVQNNMLVWCKRQGKNKLTSSSY